MDKKNRYKCEMDVMDGYEPTIKRIYIYADNIEDAIKQIKKSFNIIEITSIVKHNKISSYYG